MKPLFTQKILKEMQKAQAQQWKEFWKANETYCEDCDNGTDTPCAVCLDEEAGK
jgi:hypothetical protein